MVGLTKTQAAAVLGVSEDAEETEIRTAFKKLALIWHPDKNDSPEATEKFKEINAAHKRMQQPDSEDEIEWDDDDDIVPFEQFMDLLAQLFARQAAARRNPFGGGSFGGGVFGGGGPSRVGGSFGRSSFGGGPTHAHVHFGGMGRGPGFVFVPAMSRSDSESEYETESEEEDEDWRYRRGEQRKAEEQRRQEAAQKRQQEAQKRQQEAAERKRREDEANLKRREEQEARRKAEAKAKHEAAEALKRQKREEKARQKERQVAGAKERAEQEARDREEALAKEKADQERKRREEQSRRDKAKAKEQAEAAAQAQADAMAAEAAARREKKRVLQPKPMRKRGSGKGADEDEAEDSPALSNPFAALKPESQVPKVKKAVKTKDLPDEDKNDELEPESEVPRVSAKAATAPRASPTPAAPAANGAAKVVPPPPETKPKVAAKVEKAPEKPKSPEEIAKEKEEEREKEARRKKSREEAARKRAEKAAYERLVQEMDEKKRIEDEDRAMALRLQAEEERLARIEAYQWQQRAKQQQEEAKRAASRQFAARHAPGAAFARPNGTAYAATAAAAAAAPLSPSPSSQSGLGVSGQPLSSSPQPFAPEAHHAGFGSTQPGFDVPEPTGFVEQPTGFVEQPTGFGEQPPGFEEQPTSFDVNDAAENEASEQLDPAVEAVWKMEQDRVEAGRRLDEDRRLKAEEQKRRREEAERVEAERRKRAEDALLQKAKLAGTGGKKAPRRRRRGGGGHAGLEEAQNWPGEEFAAGSSEWGAGSAGDAAPGEWEDVPGDGGVDEGDFEEREREAEALQEEERRRGERQQAAAAYSTEEDAGAAFDINSILAEIASRAEHEHRASPTSPLEAVSAASDGSPDVHVPPQKTHRPPPRYAPYQPLKQAGGFQQPNGGPPMRTEADILKETWGESNLSGATTRTTFPAQGGSENAPIDPMQVIRQLGMGRTSPPQEDSTPPAPAYTTPPQYPQEYSAKSQTPQYNQHDMYSHHPQQYSGQSTGGYQSTTPAPPFLQPQVSAYPGYPSSYSSGPRVQTTPASGGPPPTLYPLPQTYPSSQFPPQQQPFSQPPTAAFPGYYSANAAPQAYKQPAAMYPDSQSGYPGSVGPPPFSSGFGGSSQTYSQGGVSQFAPQQMYGGQHEMGAQQYGWQGQYPGTGQASGLHSSGQYTPSSDTPSPPDTSVTQPIRQGDSEYWVNERADANGADNEDEYPPAVAEYNAADHTLGSNPEPQAEVYYHEGEDGANGPQSTAFVNASHDGGYGNGYREESGYTEAQGWQGAQQERQPEWTAVPTGWGGGEEQQPAAEAVAGGDHYGSGEGYGNGRGYTNGGGYGTQPVNGGFGGHARNGEGQANGGSGPQYPSWGGGESQHKQATGWGEEQGGQQNGNGQHANGPYDQPQQSDGPLYGKGGSGFGRTWQRASDAYSNGSNASGGSVSGGGGQRPCRFFQRGNCKFGNRCKDAHVAANGPSRTAAPADRSPPFHARDPLPQAAGWGADPSQETDQSAGFGAFPNRGSQGGEGRRGGFQGSGDARKPGIYESEGEKSGHDYSGGPNSNYGGRRGYAGSQWQPRGAPPRRSPM